MSDAKHEMRQRDPDRDGVVGAPGSHPVGTGVGAAGGAVAGATMGAVMSVFAAPIGAVVGGLVGAVIGGLVGGGIAEAASGADEEAFWRRTYRRRPYVAWGETYDDYRPAYRFGWESAVRSPGIAFEQAEPYLERDWAMARGNSHLDWAAARGAARDAWERVNQRIEASRNQPVPETTRM